MSWCVLVAKHAAEREAAVVRYDLARGLPGLATVAATAPFAGMALTVWGIVSSFVGCGGEKSACMAAVAKLLSQSMMPTAFGLGLGIAALAGYRYLRARTEEMDVEMRNAVLDLVDWLERWERPASHR